MLFLILKSIIIPCLCLITVLFLKNNNANIRQKIIFFTLLLCVFLPIFSYLPTSFTVRYSTPDSTGEIKELEPQLSNTIRSNKTAKNTEKPQLTNSLSRHPDTKFSFVYWSRFLLLLYLCGLSYRLLKLFFQYKFLINLNIASEIYKQNYLLKDISNKKINYYISDQTSVPFLSVQRHSIEIFLPIAARQWDRLTIENIISHELCHYKRKDHLAIWLAEIVAAVYWFNPLIAHLVHMHKEHVELACDYQLILDGIDSSHYAKTILNMPTTSDNLPIVASIASQPSFLKQRVLAILDRKKQNIGMSKALFILIVAICAFMVGCVNNSTLLSINNLIELISYDLPSFRTGSIDNGSIHISTLYDGKDKNNTFIEFEFSTEESNHSTWLKLGPLKKFTNQIQTWNYKTINGAFLTGKYRVSGVVPDGVVDGVAVGIYYTDDNDKLIIHKSVGPIVNKTPNIICSWPLDLKDKMITKYTPQLTSYNAESIKRMLCGSQLLVDGIYFITQIPK